MTDLPDSLVRFEALLERSVERDLRRGRRAAPRAIVLRAAVAVALVAAIALGANALLAGEALVGRPGVAQAAPHERAAAVLDPGAPAIVHDVRSTRHVAADGSVSSWREETWRQTTRPYARREVTIRPGGPPVETATVGREPAALYDAATRTIYTQPPTGGPALGTPAPAGDGDPLRTQLATLLRSGDARAIRETTHDGRRAIAFELRNAWPDGTVIRWSYVVDAESYEPIVLTAVAPDGARTVTRFERYEVLPDDAANRKLLDLRAQHPEATVDRTERGYAEAQARIGAPGG